MGVNVLLFLVFQIGVEPWRRKRLVKGFEDKVMEALEREGSVAGATPTEIQVAQSAASVEAQEALEATIPSDVEDVRKPAATDPLSGPSVEILPQLQEDTPSQLLTVEPSTISKLQLRPQSPLSTFQSIKEWIRDIFSERQVVLRRIDVTKAAFEGAAAGMAIVGAIIILLRHR